MHTEKDEEGAESLTGLGKGKCAAAMISMTHAGQYYEETSLITI